MVKIKLYVITLIIIFSQQLCWGQVQMRVQGTVTNIATGEPVSKVTLLDGYKILGTSDDFGNFSIVVDREMTLSFYHSNYNDVDIKLSGQQNLNVMMSERMIEIEEVVVFVERSRKNVTVEPTDIVILGDNFYIDTKFWLPTQLFDTDYRFILQPTIYNITREERQILTPIVIDGKNYTTVQHRHRNFGETSDPLSSFVVERNTTKEEQAYIYRDSLKVDPQFRDDDYRVDCYMVLGSYRPPLIYSDTVTIAKGVRNDLRFFKYDFAPLRLDGTAIDVDSEEELTQELMNDETNRPAPDMDLYDTRGVVNISYVINSSQIDANNTENQRYLGEIRTVLQDIQANIDATLHSISITGYSSPDGTYENNKKLATARTKTLLSTIVKDVNPELLPYITLRDSSVVARWSDLVDVIAAEDSSLSKRVEEIVNKYNDDYAPTNVAMKRTVPEYYGAISKTYLPRLRRAEYSVEYSIYRENTVEEITQMYNSGDSISPYNYYKLIMHQSDKDKAIEMEQRAIASYPRFTWLANRVAVRNIINDSPSLETLQPAMGKDAPSPMIYNQALTALHHKEYDLTDSLMLYVKDERLVQEMDAVLDLYVEGDFNTALSTLAEPGSLNEIVLIMALEEYGRANTLLQTYLEDIAHQNEAPAWYLYAICASKLYDVLGAMDYLQHSFTLDPSLEDIAMIDSNISDIYELIQSMNDRNNTPMQ